MSRRTHGESGPVGRGTVEYRIWSGMVSRCTNTANRSYPRYGGRGIGVALCWRQYENFLADLGRRPSPAHSLDREDWNKGYAPGNVRWATREEQSRNRQDRRPLTVDGTTRLLCEWTEQTGVPVKTIWQRVYKDRWLPAAAVFTPVRQGRPAHCQHGHLLEETARWEGQSRRCRTCKKLYDAKYRRGAA